MTNNIVTNSVDPNLVYIGDKLDGAIASISTKLGVAADHFWPVLVKKQYLDGIALSISILIPILLCLICWVVVYCRRKIQKEGNYDDIIYWIFFFGGALLTVISMCGIICNIGYIINKIYNPEAVALIELLKGCR